VTRAAAWIVALALACTAAAQAPSRLAEVEIGFLGVPVAEAWNPVRVTLRDVGSGQLTVTVDQGSLREGALPWTTVLPVAGGAGVRVLEADLYLPNWRSLRWTLEAGGALVASGALPRDAADRRPVDLVVGARPGSVAERVEGRVLDLPASALPTRAAAYDGVRSVWFDGRVPAPSPAALTAAAAAGATIVAYDAARDDAVWGRLLPDAGWVGVGAGAWWTGPPPSGAELQAGRLDLAAWGAAFAAASAVALPTGPPTLQVVVLASLYVLMVVVGWRLGGAPGLATWLVVVAGATLLAWSRWRPPASNLVETRALHVAAGDLALRLRAHDLLTLPAGEVGVAAVARPALPVAGRTLLGSAPSTTLTLGRWRGATLLEAPAAAVALLGWAADGRPSAVGGRTLTDVRVVGGAAWARLEPGDAAGEPSDPAPLSGPAATFEALLPIGAAWARQGADWHVALPPEVRW
jgi:hypothetical protein